MVLHLKHGDHLITDEQQIQQIFVDDMRGTLGTARPTLSFDVSNLYSDTHDLTSLDHPFSELEIQFAVASLAANKASGPDGLPNEFIKTFWPLVKGDIIQAFHQFYNGRLDLREINRANINMIPKIDSPTDAKDFRPISIINLTPNSSPIMALQYADDIAFILKADIKTVTTFKIMLRLFSKMSSLEVNYSKSTIIPFNLHQHQYEVISAIMGCTISQLSITYLGLPLTVKKLARRTYMKLIEKLQYRLQGWQGNCSVEEEDCSFSIQ
ncbi:uncharacterized protein LOC144546241 [Carex rostrata]